EVSGSLSGTDILANTSLRSSGTLMVQGATTLSGAVTMNDEVTFGSGIIINGITYVFPAVEGGSGTVLATDGDGQLTWTNSALLIKAGQGLTAASGFVSLTAAFSGTTIEATTLLSGASVHAQNNLTSSGGLQVDGKV
ncbi:MAG: hypothetical protein QGH82_03495, partial [Candidatus Woesearchaeota archaeon]|nr:hypothetical protein [Candidatus Woesearchaeota archaeon]